MVFSLLHFVGDRTLAALFRLGESMRLLGRVVACMPFVWRVRGETVTQMIRIGVDSLPLVAVTSAFTGMVLAVQTSYQIEEYVPQIFIAAAVAKATIIELGPVITGLVISGRVGASIAAELGTMRVTEQIDALETMAIDPVQFLCLPRIFAGLVMMPVIVTYGCLISICGGWAVCVYYLGMSTTSFLEGMRQFVYPYDVYSGLFKSLVFGGTLTMVGCYYGYCTSEGAAGVGRAATRSVVTNCLLILMFDYFLAMLLFPVG